MKKSNEIDYEVIEKLQADINVLRIGFVAMVVVVVLIVIWVSCNG